MKIGILVHPFWYRYSYEDNLQHYIDAIDKFDYVYVLMPILNRHKRDLIIEMFRNDFIDALFDKDLHNDVYNLYCRVLVSSLVKGVASFRSVLKDINKRKISKQELIKTLKEMDIKRFKHTFSRFYCMIIDGDMVWAKRVKKACKDFKYKTKGKNVKHLYAGGVSTAIVEMAKYNLDREHEYFIFGEYYNLCVESIKRGLEDNHGISVTKLPELSIYLRETGEQELPVEEALKFMTYVRMEDNK